jgi:hypothetical protein
MGLVASGLLLASLYAAYQPGRPFPHYLLLLLLPVTLGAAAALGAALKHGKRPALVAGGFLTLTVAAPVFQGMLQSGGDSLAALAASPLAMAAPITGRLSAWARPGDAMAIWGWAPELYVLTGTVHATRDGHTQRQIEDAPQREYYRARFVSDLRAHPPVVFADAVGPYRLTYQDRASQGYETVPALREFVEANYELRDDVQCVRVFVRRGAREATRQAPARAPLAIACGGADDRFFYGGAPLEFREENAPAGYRTARFCRSTCEYSIPLENGPYRARLRFIELIYPAAGARTFDVTVNQQAVLSGFDIFREAGGTGRPLVREMPVEVKDGRLTIGFVPKSREALVSAIEIEPLTSPRQP